MKSVFNLDPNIVSLGVTREEWTRGPGTSPAVKGLVWFTDGSRTVVGTGAGVYGQYGTKAQHLSRKTCYRLSG